MLRTFLTDKGYAVVGADDAGDALMLIEQIPPDVLLLDIAMPGMDGMELLRRISEAPPAMAVVMVSANQDEAVARAALRAGAFDYITKPVDLDHLAAVVAAALTYRGSGARHQSLAPAHDHAFATRGDRHPKNVRAGKLPVCPLCREVVAPNEDAIWSEGFIVHRCCSRRAL
jgi:two-component system, NtrC family, response regulator AtoC